MTMLNTVEAVLHTDGALHFLKPVHLAAALRVLVTFTDVKDESLSGAQLSPHSSSVDWMRSREDAAWAHLRPVAH